MLGDLIRPTLQSGLKKFGGQKKSYKIYILRLN